MANTVRTPAHQHGSAMWQHEIDLHLLNRIRYLDNNINRTRNLRLFQEMAPHWRRIGGTVGLEPAQITALQNPGTGTTPMQCIEGVIAEWQGNAPNLASANRFPYNWMGLYNLLTDCQMGGAAERLRNAIESNRSDFLQNFESVQSQPPAQQQYMPAPGQQQPQQQFQPAPGQQWPQQQFQPAPGQQQPQQQFQPAPGQQQPQQQFQPAPGQQQPQQKFQPAPGQQQPQQQFQFQASTEQDLIVADSEQADDDKGKGQPQSKKGDVPSTCETYPAIDRGTHMPKLKLQHDENITPLNIKGPVFVPNLEGYYDMTAKKHGVCLIINNEHFGNVGKNREGTARDEYNLIETWQYLGYHVLVYHDATSLMIEELLKTIDKILSGIKDLANDSFVCCILSHGCEHNIGGTDHRKISIMDIENILGKSKILKEKPKLLFIQACQGKNIGAEIVNIESDPKDNSPQWDDCSPQLDNMIITTRSDIYISLGTAFGDKAYRQEHGTPYVRALCRILCEESQQCTLDQIQKKINKQVPNEEYPEHIMGSNYRQQPCGIDQLRKTVHFFYKA